MKLNLIIFLLFILSSCETNTTGDSTFYSKVITSTKSPDLKKVLTLKEYGVDTADCVTQVWIDFGKTGAGVYSVDGRNRDIKTYWQDNNTIVIETKKEYKSDQKWPQVQSFGDIIKVVYIEK